MTKAQHLSGTRALYFEDQADKVEAICDFLRCKLAIRLTQATTPKEAFAYLKQDQFDLIILDVRIRDDEDTSHNKQKWTRYGVYFLKELREGRIPGRTPSDVPVLVITCVVSTADVEEIQRIGNSAGGRCRYLEKPVSRLAMVEEAICDLMAARPGSSNEPATS
jgi:CheY-like chemotaxis protein